MYTFEYDEGPGILLVRVLGVWTMPEIDRYAIESAVQFRIARLKAGSLRLLVDCSLGYICPRDLVEPLAKAGLQHSRADDRAALVVGSSLSKLQIQRMMKDAPSRIFTAESEARTWLVAPAGQDAAAA